MENIRQNIEKVRENIPDGVLLIAVTKTHTPQEINEAIDCGITDIGENKVQEILEKYDAVKPVRWHMIGHLQTNKVRQVIDKVSMIHSVDSLKLAKEISKRAEQHDITMDILIQINPAHEESKFGIDTEETKTLIRQIADECPNVRIRGLMTVVPHSYEEDQSDIRPYFAAVKKVYDECMDIEHPSIDFKYLSMGMTHDYITAIEEGSNTVRIGTAIFGARVY